MASINVHDETARELKALAAAAGLSIEDYVQSLIPGSGQATTLTAEEFGRLLDNESIDVSPLPDGFSRSDIYADHD